MNTYSDIEQLISKINHASTPEEVITAITEISSSDTQELAVINSVIKVLSHHHPAVRAAAVESLVKLKNPTVQPLISAYEASQDQGLQAHIIQALAQIGSPDALDLLAEVVGTTVANHCQGNVRRIAARGLGKIASNSQDAEVIRFVQEKLIWAVLSPEDWGLRYAAAVSLQEIATPEAKTALKNAIAGEADLVVRSRMTLALA
ncbi:HEAT repeat domain-containing protein [Nostoc sp. FACHB-152]|uniref:HEAT repeat domain-containing protein n=1 Tax=unclassified Nostoc TaxID=2593658 RepID=UPI0016836B09|nr:MULTISPECIES: HEAT repeat domain-containing protein [unclassified Nostoc]MBD2448141.1 HEAT repeat domain-containing protein [Nostoc sp. FACHB-152]MBD2470582.1 HEAT repeat domain-containing protein [Nostoc sp. FACHB-145]